MNLAEATAQKRLKDGEIIRLKEEISTIEEDSEKGFVGRVVLSVESCKDPEICTHNIRCGTVQSDVQSGESAILLLNSRASSVAIKSRKAKEDCEDVSYYTSVLDTEIVPTNTYMRSELECSSDSGIITEIVVKASYTSLSDAIEGKRRELITLNGEMKVIDAAIKETSARSSKGGSQRKTASKSKKGLKGHATQVSDHAIPLKASSAGVTLTSLALSSAAMMYQNRALALFVGSSICIYAMGDYASA